MDGPLREIEFSIALTRVLVIGGGIAGCMAALAAVQSGAQVMLVSRAPGATALYAGWARTPAGEHQAAISVGYRPTFGKTDLRVEAYLLDFDGDLYQQHLELRFVTRLRDQVKFPSAEALSAQIARDVEETREVLSRSRP